MASQDGTWCTLTRCAGIAEAAHAQGHEVLVQAPASLATRIRDLVDVGVVACPNPPGLSGMLNDEAEVTSVGDFAALMGWTERGYFDDLLVEDLALIEDWRPHVVIADFRLEAGLACHLAGVPLTLVATWELDPLNPENIREPRETASVLDLAAQHLGRPVATCAELLFAAAGAVVVPSIRQLAGQRRGGSEYRYVGHVFSKRLEAGELPSELRWSNERPRLLAYLSASDLDYPRMLDDLEDACQRVGGCGIFMLGGQDYLKATQVEHGRVRVVDEAPAAALLRGADLAITHGGLNSVLQALRCGVPLLGVPLDSAERQANVRRAVHLGVALTTEEEVPDGSVIARLASVLCAEQSFKQAAMQIGELIDRAPGAKGVVAVAADLFHAAAKG